MGTGRECLTGEAICEIALLFRTGWHRRKKGLALAQARALVVAENEGLVLADGTTEKSTELIAFKWLLTLVEVVDSVELVVADKLVDSAVNAVGARLQDHVNRCAATPELGAHRVFFGTELLDGVGRGQHDDATQSELVVIHSIQQKVVVGDAQAVDRNGFVSAVILKDTTADVGPGLATIGSRPKIGELDKISSVQRQLGNAPLGFDRQ